MVLFRRLWSQRVVGWGSYLQPVNVGKRCNGCPEEFGEHSTDVTKRNGDRIQIFVAPISDSGRFMSSSGHNGPLSIYGNAHKRT